MSLKYQYNNLQQHHKSLGKAIAIQEQLKQLAAENNDAKNLFSAGVIKHFELTYETAWKFLKLYLTISYGSSATSPKQVFRECETHKLFPPQLVNSLITLADARNNTTHIYGQILAQEICNDISKHHEAFGVILKTIKMPTDWIF